MMGMIEEGRQLFQDFVAPEIRAIEARLDTIEKQVASLDAKTDKRTDRLESKIDRNQTQLMHTLHRMENYTQVLERLARLESKVQNIA
jgi:tetrahydromethanopterin S-methyltransferase subunit G